MTKRYRITLHVTDNGDEYDIEHEVDQVLLTIGSRLYFSDPEATSAWEPVSGYLGRTHGNRRERRRR